MNTTKNSDSSHLLNAEIEQLKKLQVIVDKALKNEQSIIQTLREPEKETLSRGERISDKVAKFGGSWSFIISFFVVLLLWIVFNSIMLKNLRFDPYPFILMNLILSCIAALQAPIIMMSQNRKEEKDRKRSENDYLINLKAEIEIQTLHQKMDLLLEEQIKILFDSQAKQLEILNRIEHEISKK